MDGDGQALLGGDWISTFNVSTNNVIEGPDREQSFMTGTGLRANPVQTPATFDVTLLGSTGQPFDHQGMAINFTAVGINDTATAPTITQSGLNKNVVSFSYTTPSVAGTFYLSILVGGIPLAGCPVAVTVTASSPTAASRSVANSTIGLPPLLLAAPSTISGLIKPVDSLGYPHRMPNLKNSFEVTIRDLSSSSQKSDSPPYKAQETPSRSTKQPWQR